LPLSLRAGHLSPCARACSYAYADASCRSCKYPKDLWRCYHPEYYGGRHAEGTQGDQELDPQGNAMFMRAPFPGLPFMGACVRAMRRRPQRPCLLNVC